jgi:multidrug resistance protein MdtO
MASLAQTIPASARPLAWLREFLKEELSPYPGRASLVARMVLAATLVMLITMIFQTPYGAFGAVYALILSRESVGATAEAVKTLAVWFTAAAVYVVVGAMLVLDDPGWRLLWVVGTLFIIFYAMQVISDYTAATRFGYLIVITIPLWDEHITAEAKVEGTLWAVGSITFASVITLLIELAWKNFKHRDDLLGPLDERLSAVEHLLNFYAEGGRLDDAAKESITRLALLGTSRLRRLLVRADYSPQYSERMSAVVALVGRIVDIAANLVQFCFQVPEEDRDRTRKLAGRIAAIRADLISKTAPHWTEFAAEENTAPAFPLLGELERTVALIPQVFTGAQSLDLYTPVQRTNGRGSTLLVADAFSNSDHVKFGLRGCLAASLCYVIYSAIDWQGLSTSVTTCILTALTTTGASRQKQVLRFGGAFVGGIIIGFGVQVYILPFIDTIVGFTILFLAVTIPTAWVITAGPRLSYLGVQIAVAFYLVNLQEFKFQTSLAVTRDRVAGILFGLFMMWLAFDQLGGPSAAVQMKKKLVSSFRLLAQFFREPSPTEEVRAAIDHAYALRETLNSNFDQVRAQADAVLFEFGESRERDLALRRQILSWQPQLRTLFVLRTTLWKYRFRLPGFELPEPIHTAQQQFDERIAVKLEQMADRLDGRTGSPEGSAQSLDGLERAIDDCLAVDCDPADAEHLRTLRSVSGTTGSLIDSLDRSLA